MTNNFHFESFASGMKAKLDPTYRRVYQENQSADGAQIWRELNRSGQKTALPFTTVTKSYNTYGRRV